MCGCRHIHVQSLYIWSSLWRGSELASAQSPLLLILPLPPCECRWACGFCLLPPPPSPPALCLQPGHGPHPRTGRDSSRGRRQALLSPTQALSGHGAGQLHMGNPRSYLINVIKELQYGKDTSTNKQSHLTTNVTWRERDGKDWALPTARLEEANGLRTQKAGFLDGSSSPGSLGLVTQGQALTSPPPPHSAES